MSFKREGNDTSLLGKLRKRRITELLAEDIPEDEAKLLCNGRFTCTVCSSNPIFDTVNMLTVHRNGKKHISNLEIYDAKKRELNHLIAARKHQQYMKDGSTSIRMAQIDDRSLLTSCPYDPRVKKVKVRKGERKPILDLGIQSRMMTSHSGKIHEGVSAAATNARNVTYGSSILRDPYEQCLSGPFKHTHQLKDIFKQKMEDPVRVEPYKSKFKRNQTVHQNITNSSLVTGVSVITGSQNLRPSLNVGSLLSSYGSNLSISPGKELSQNTLNPAFTTSETLSTEKSSTFQYRPFFQHPITIGTGICLPPGIPTHKLILDATVPPPPPPPPHITSTEHSSLSVSNLPASPVKTFVNAERVKEQSLTSQKLRLLQGSGWKRDWDGKWMRDEQAEFDSDDEPPDIT